MIESPMIQELIAERTRQTTHRHILRYLTKRFGQVPEEVSAAVRLTTEEAALDTLLDLAIFCPDLAAFRAHLQL
jgi:hypothetical protein